MSCKQISKLETDPKKCGEWLTQIMKRYKVSNVELSRRLGISARMIYNLKKGDVGLSKERVLAILFAVKYGCVDGEIIFNQLKKDEA